ncbi:hypothetical protein J7E88_28435 [Streptomyces sp. ISL-10]|uniref:hypothetical protein n=1 Tax=Streptomyces sp. ISL-10 TaxID=2819172 RepID=UPI001BE955B2|nr:hypothetical protein [Streptomyces sp. ISL-10]MBT2369138.1 hypothetical protein [Streptomyces sp. ISL-10]
MSLGRSRGSVPRRLLWPADVLVFLVWAASVWVATRVEAGPGLRTAALFVHLGALVLGMGSVLTIDYYGLLWLCGKRTLSQVLDFAAPLHLLVWTGLAGMVLSGVVLGPDPAAALIRVKLALVLLIAINGVHAQALHRTLQEQGDEGATRRLLVRLGISAVLSQLGWWGAVGIGFLNSQS